MQKKFHAGFSTARQPPRRRQVGASKWYRVAEGTKETYSCCKFIMTGSGLKEQQGLVDRFYAYQSKNVWSIISLVLSSTDESFGDRLALSPPAMQPPPLGCFFCRSAFLLVPSAPRSRSASYSSLCQAAMNLSSPRCSPVHYGTPSSLFAEVVGRTLSTPNVRQSVSVDRSVAPVTSTSPALAPLA